MALAVPVDRGAGWSQPRPPAAIVCFSRTHAGATERALQPISLVLGLTEAEAKLE